MSEPNYSIDWTARTLGTVGSIAKGDALVFDAAQGISVVATAAARAAAGGGAEAIALVAFGGSMAGDVTFQAAGVVAQSVSGLEVIAAGAAKLVRVSSAGRLERIDAYTDGDDVVGYAKSNGRVSLHIGLPWEFIAAAAAGASLPDYSIQYRTPAGALGGAAHASISADGYTEHSADRAGGAATTGDDRFARYGSSRVRNRADDNDLCVFEHASVSSVTYDGLNVGGLGGDVTLSSNRTFNAVAIYAKNSGAIQAGFVGGVIAAGLIAFAPGVVTASGSGSTARFAHAHPNLAVAPVSLIAALAADPFNGGRGYLWVEDVASVRAGTLRTTGFGLWSRVADHHPMVTIGTTDYDLLNPEGKQSVSITGSSLASPTNVSLANGRIIELTGAGTDTALIIITPLPGSTADSSTFTIINKATSVSGIQINNAGSGGISCSGAANWVGHMYTIPQVGGFGVGGIVITSAGAVSSFVI